MTIDFSPGISEDPEMVRLRQRFTNVFGGEEGRRVLGEILMMTHFGVPLNSEEERIEYNLGIVIARMCGAMRQVEILLGILKEE